MPARKRPKTAILVLVIALISALLVLQLRAIDQSKIARASEGLAQARALNSQKKPQETRQLLDQFLAQPPRIFLQKNEFQSLLDQLKIEKAHALIMLNSKEDLTRILDGITTSPAKEDASRIKKTLDDNRWLSQASELSSAGRWYEAEKLYRKHFNDSIGSLPHRLKYREILLRQGRNEEARSIYAEGIFALEHPENGLLELAIQDNEEILPEKWRAELSLLLGVVPDDPRLLLASANLEQWQGNFSRAQQLLEKLLLQMPDDAPTRFAAMKNAMARSDSVGALKSIENLELTEAEALSVSAWFCRASELLTDETQLLEQLIIQKPIDRSALSRLAELGLLLNKPDKAKTYQGLKKNAEKKIVDYYRLCRDAAPISQAKAVALSEAAAGLGLPFDSWAWKELGRTGKLDPAKKPVLERKKWVDWISPELVSRLKSGESSQVVQPGQQATALKFINVAEKSGLGRFTHQVSQASGQMIPPLSFAGGLGILDYDNDGLEDVFAVQSGEFPPKPARPNSGDRLFRNLGHGKFEDVTAKAGIDKFPRGFGHGVAVGDIDNDGFADVFITRWRGYALWRNRGDGTFEDVTGKYGLSGDRDWPTSAAFADFDNDGDLDLYVCHYMEWVEGKAYPCIDPSKPTSYDCRPRDFPAMKDHLFRNDGGKFTDISELSGVAAADSDGRGLGVVATDVNDDGLIDIFVANDTTANLLFINKGGMKFEESAFTSGVAANAQGGFQAGMGVAAADVNGDGLVDLAVTNFYNESTSIFQNLGAGFFADRTAALGVAAPSRNRLGFGLVIVDFDNDGFKEILTANGHVTDGRPAIPYRMPLQLFQNQRKSGQADAKKTESRLFVDVTKQAGEPFSHELMARGLATADFDLDGLIDSLVQSQGDPLIHLKNETKTANHWVGIQLSGTRSNRDGIGAKISLKSGDRVHVEWVVGGGSFQSASSKRIYFGFDQREKLNGLEIRWPSGTVDKLEKIEPNSIYQVVEGSARAVRMKISTN